MQLVLFGAGTTAHDWIERAHRLGKILAIADNDASKWGQSIEGYPIISPNEISSFRPDRIIISSTATLPIFEQLRKLGFDESIIDSPLTSYRNRAFWDQLHRAHSGKRIFIIGNGPSLTFQDLETLHRHRELTFAFNKIFLAFNECSFRPSYYLVEDDLVAKNNQREIRKLHGFPKLFPDYLLPVLGEPDSETGLFFFDVQNPSHFKPQFSTGRYRIHSGYTCTYSAIQFALWMDCSEIILLGLDFSFELPSNTQKNVLINKNERNHFSPSYRLPGEAWNRPFLEQSRQAYRLAKTICEERGIRILNASRTSKLDVFPKIDFDDLFYAT